MVDENSKIFQKDLEQVMNLKYGLQIILYSIHFFLQIEVNYFHQISFENQYFSTIDFIIAHKFFSLSNELQSIFQQIFN